MVQKGPVGSAASVRVLLARMSAQSLGWLAGTIALGCAGRLLFVGTAYVVAHDTMRASVELGVLGAVLFAVLRIVQSLARTSVQRDVYAMTSRAVLASDVLAIPSRDLRRVALDGSYYAVALVADATPSFVADVVSSLAIVPLLLAHFEPRLLAIAAMAMVVVTLAAFLLRAMARRLEERSGDAYGAVIEDLIGAIDGRLEIVAGAREAHVAAAFDRQLAGYEKLSRRAALGRAFLGRAPLAAGALSVGLVALLDTSSRMALEGAFVTKALLLAAAVPAIHGAVLGLHGMLRAVVFVAPLVEMLGAESPHRGKKDGTRVELPAPVLGRGLTFAYEEGGVPILTNVSFDWMPGKPFVLAGPNGAGKSTLLRLILGLRLPTAGAITFGGHDGASLDFEHLRRQVAYLPQRPSLGEAHRSVAFALRLSVPGADPKEMRAALERTGVLAMLGEHGSDELATPVGELSAGQRQRVALARVLLQRDARMVLLDEPDANLDASGIELIATIVREMTARGIMVAIAAHTPELATLSHEGKLALPARQAHRV